MSYSRKITSQLTKDISPTDGFDLALVSKYRSVLMGVAIIAITFCHVDLAQNRHGIPITQLAQDLHLLIVGVDIFMFLSGFGIYYSWSSGKYSYIQFLKRRISRIIPYYMAIGGMTYFLSDIVYEKSNVARFFKDFLFVTLCENKSTRYWFILAIIVFYIFAPLLIWMLTSGTCNTVKFLSFLVCWWIITYFTAHHWSRYIVFKMGIERFPIFAIGIYMGNGEQGKEKTVVAIWYCLDPDNCRNLFNNLYASKSVN